MKAQRGEIADRLAAGMAAQVLHGQIPTAKTTLEVGYFTGDVEAAWTSFTISAPATINLRWNTNAQAAEKGRLAALCIWPINASCLGYAGAAPGGIFTIDLGKHLPAAPPNAPAVYVIRVIPGTAPKMMPGPAQGEMIKNSRARPWAHPPTTSSSHTRRR